MDILLEILKEDFGWRTLVTVIASTVLSGIVGYGVALIIPFEYAIGLGFLIGVILGVIGVVVGMLWQSRYTKDW